MELIWSREELESLLDHPSRNVQRWAIGRALDLYPDLSDHVIALLPSASGSTASFILDSLCDHHVHITDPGPLLETLETFDREDIETTSTALLLRSGHTPPGYDPATVELGSSASILADTEAGFNHLLQLYHRCQEDNSSVLFALSQACGFDEVFDELADAEEEENIREILEYRGDVWGYDLFDLEGALEDGTALDILDGALTRTVPTDGEPWKRGILAELEDDRTRIESIRDVAKLRTSLSRKEQVLLLTCVLCLRRNQVCQNRLLDADNVAQLWAILAMKTWRGIPDQALREFLLSEQPEQLFSSLHDALSEAKFNGLYPFQLLNSIDAPGRFDFFKEALAGRYDDVISDEAAMALKEGGLPAARHIMQCYHELSPRTRLSILGILDSLPTREVVDFYISHFEEYMCERGSVAFVESVKRIASSRFLAPLLEEWREGEIGVGRAISLISEIHGIRDERIDRVVQDIERITPGSEPPSTGEGISLLEYAMRSKIMTFPLRCTQCGHTYHYELKNISVDEDYQVAIGDIVECKRCGALQAYELTPHTYLSIRAEITRQLILLDQDEPPESLDSPVKPCENFEIRAGGQAFDSVVEAYQFLRGQIEKRPRDASLQRLMANILRNGGRGDLALPYYLEAINLNPGDAETCYCIGDILIGQGRYEEAIPYVERLVPLCREGKMDDNLRRDMFRALLDQAHTIAEETGYKVELFRLAQPDELDRDSITLDARSLDLSKKEDFEWVYHIFRHGQVPKEHSKPDVTPEAARPHKESPQAPFIKGKKIGRNDPCPCGSGKKYKKCCGRK